MFSLFEFAVGVRLLMFVVFVACVLSLIHI